MKRNDKTPMTRKEDVSRKWFIFDAEGKTLGRFCTEIAKVLRGKHKPDFTPHADTGDGVIVLNASKIKVTGDKEAQKTYFRHTGYPSGGRVTPYREMLASKPEYIIQHAVKGMMPKTRLGNAQLKRLRVHAGAEHRMDAQQPIQVNL